MTEGEDRVLSGKSVDPLMTTKFKPLYVGMSPSLVSAANILNGSTDGYKHAIAACRICDKNIMYCILLKLQFGEIATHTHIHSFGQIIRYVIYVEEKFICFIFML